MAKKIIVADASPLIAFGRINQFNILKKLFRQILTPQSVIDECLKDMSRPGAKTLNGLVNNGTISVLPNPEAKDFLDIYEFLGCGEANAIVLALQLQSGLLIDEKLGRMIAIKFNLSIIGTAGTLLLAKQKKIIRKIKPLINELKECGYFLSKELISEVLRKANE